MNNPKPKLYFELSDLHREITYLHLPTMQEQPQWAMPETFNDAYHLGQQSVIAIVREIIKKRAEEVLKEVNKHGK